MNLLSPRQWMRCIALLALSGNLFAMDLVSAYRAAAGFDAELAAARAQLEAQRQEVGITRADLLPDLRATAGYEIVEFGDRTPLDPDTPAVFTSDGAFSNEDYSVSVTQPLFRADAWFALKTVKASVKQAEAEYSEAEQDLILRTAQAYFDVLRARDNLATSRAEERAFKRQLEQAQERYEVGLVAITGVLEAQAAFDNSSVARIIDEGELDIALEQLERLTGQPVDAVLALSESFKASKPQPDNKDAWADTALDQNWSIRANEFALKAAQENVKTQRSGFLPTVDASASFARIENGGPGLNVNQTESSRVEFRINVPIFQGGRTTFSTRQARSQEEEAQHLLRATQRQVRVDTRSTFRQVSSTVESISARQQSIRSSESALEATETGYRVGTRNIVEVLDAQRALFAARRDFSNARYDYIIQSLQLKELAGTLSPEDLDDLNRFLEASAASALEEQYEPVPPATP